MSILISMIQNGGVAGYVILTMGAVSLAIIVDRTRVLFWAYSMKSRSFLKEVRSLVLEDKIEEAISKCSQYKEKPLAATFKMILERADRDEESLQQAQDIALSEYLPLFGKRLGYLMMISNVATLVGLLGTIQGLILSFNAVSQADPASKQTLLAEGISIAMYTTALGLSVAIPTMIVYSLLQSRQNSLSESLIEHSSKIVEWLSSRQYRPLSKDSIFHDPRPLSAEQNPPPVYMKQA